MAAARNAATARAWKVAGAHEVRSLRCAAQLQACLRAAGKPRATVAGAPKGAAWKVAVAAGMKQETDAPNGWLAERLKMGSATRVSQVVGAVARQPTSLATEISKPLSERLAT